jgi:hypothetical protein
MVHSRQFIPLIQAQPPFFVGVDVGGTNIKLGVVDDQGVETKAGWYVWPLLASCPCGDAAVVEVVASRASAVGYEFALAEFQCVVEQLCLALDHRWLAGEAFDLDAGSVSELADGFDELAAARRATAVDVRRPGRG